MFFNIAKNTAILLLIHILNIKFKHVEINNDALNRFSKYVPLPVGLYDKWITICILTIMTTSIISEVWRSYYLHTLTYIHIGI